MILSITIGFVSCDKARVMQEVSLFFRDEEISGREMLWCLGLALEYFHQKQDEAKC